MCFEFDARPPAPPVELLIPPIAGAAGAELLEVTRVQEDLKAAADALGERAGVSTPATVGFCLGGFQSFMAAAEVPGLSAAVGFYGILSDRFGVPGPIDRAGDMRCPVLGL